MSHVQTVTESNHTIENVPIGDQTLDTRTNDSGCWTIDGLVEFKMDFLMNKSLSDDSLILLSNSDQKQFYDQAIWTLDPESVLENVPIGDWTLDRAKIYTRTHDSGWTISGKISNDWYSWVEEFRATHEKFGTVVGFNYTGIDATIYDTSVYATSEEGLRDFIETHTPRIFDLGDI